jgi:HlyD family secretion protein
MRSRNVVVVAAGVVLLGAVGWYVLSSRGGPDMQIETVTVDRGDIVRSIATSGTVSPLVTVEVGSQVSGTISQLFADFNSPVKADQVVAQIDPKAFEQRVTQAKADLSVAEANIDVQKANIAKTQAKLKEAERALERNQTLKEQGNVSAAALDTALATRDSAVADVATAKAQLRTAEATLVQRQAALSSAQIDLSYTKIKSPIDGIVIERTVDVGQTVAASMTTPIFFKIAQDLRNIQIEASVDEADIGNVKDGDITNFTVDAYPDRKFEGKVTQVRLAPTEEGAVVTYTVIISADNPRQLLLPGMTANVEIITGKRENVLRVRNEALRFRAPAAWTPADAPRGGGAFAPAGPRPGNGAGNANRGNAILSQLPFEITPEQRTAIQDDLRKEMQAAAAGGGFRGGDLDRDAMRKQMEQRIESVMARHLTDEQMAKFHTFQDQRSHETVTEVWVKLPGEEPQRRMARLGITDNRYTEIVGGPLKEGDTVISRVTERTDG